MKPETIFVLEEAAWPALLMEAGGVIRRANQAAVRIFGPAAQGPASPLRAFWAAENDCLCEQFLHRLTLGAATPDRASFRLQSGETRTFRVQVSPVVRERERYLVLQFFEDAAAAGPPPPAASRPLPEAGPGARAGAPAPAPAQSAEAAGQFALGADNPAGLDPSLAQRQRLECALQLTRTVALDFANALTGILGHTSLILSEMEPNHRWRPSLLEVEKSAEKASEIVSDLAAFSRQEKEPAGQSVGNLNAVLRRAVEAFKGSAPAGLRWNVALASQVYAAKFDEARMQQAFVKILENAVQAVGPAGAIGVLSRNVDQLEPAQDGTAQIGAGHHVCVEFTDNGEGIAPEVLPRVFEPFFTTRKGGDHRGLGLAWVYGIVTNHGGSVAITSQVGQGTSVRIYLPALKKFMKDHAFKSEDLRGDQTILMVDDEELVLTMGQTILSAYGYRVVTANSGARALELLAQAPQPPDLVVTDMVMPQMSGREFIERLQAAAPAVRILCTSGYVRNPRQEDEAGFLRKPFTSQELLRKVKQALE